MKKMIVLCLTVTLVLTSSMAFATLENDATNMIADTLFMRPIGLVSCLFGGTMYIVSLPFALMTKSQDQTYEALVKEPFEYVFKRPVGEFGSGL